MAVLGEMIGRTPAESWRSIRSRRAVPPVRLTDQPRIATFRASLEQAEQQFAAAASIGYDSRPLNLFYGLSQAGRAIAAASSAAEPDWQLEGHGILARNLERAASIGDVELFSQAGRKGSFQRLSRLLGSPTPAGEPGKSPILDAMAVPWHAVDAWPYLLETQYSAELDPKNMFVPLDVTLPPHEAITPGSANFPDGAHSIDVIMSRLGRTEPSSRPTADEFLDHYPILRTRTSLGQMWGEHQIKLLWANGRDKNPQIRHDSFTLYRGQRIALPAMLESDEALHPLMGWWAALFALSMLARYQPDRWTNMINVDRHPQATAIEYVLDLARSAVPDLIDETIAAVSA